MNKILVWDLPVRLGHWLMVAGFVIAWLTGDSEEWRLVHVFAGGTVAAAALFRLVWGFVGSRHARFADFVRGPGTALDYLRSLLGPSPRHFTGHNPAGGYAILALLLLAPVTAAAGWFTYQEMGGEWLEEFHEAAAAGMLTVVAIHLAGVAVGSLTHRENLVRAMVTGRKQGAADDAITGVRPVAAAMLLAWIAFATWWIAR